jgi:phosphoribosylformylglycinamidine synthase
MKKHTFVLPAAGLTDKFTHYNRTKGTPMAKIVVDVMLKPEILDPQGTAVGAALPRLGFSFAKSVRQGKRFEIEIDGEATPEHIAQVEKAAETLLANPVIETFTVRVEK